MKALRIGLCLLFAFTVLAFGVVEVWSESILEIGTAALLILWACIVYRTPGAKVQWNPLNWPLLGLIGIGLFQLAFHATVYTFLTRAEVLRFTAYFVLFFLIAQAFRGAKELSGLAWFLILFCFAVSLFGIIQHFTSEKQIYWLSWIHPAGDPFGPYANRNHFAGFVELTLPVGIAFLVFRGMSREAVPLLGLLTIVPVSAIILSGSRGGIISFVFELVVLAILARRRRVAEVPHVGTIAIIGVAALSLVAWVGAGKAIERFSTAPLNDVSLARRISMFRGAAHIFVDHPVKGAGLGALIAIFPRYETAYDGYVIAHVHNDYIETLAETGLLGGLCGFSFLWIFYRDSLRAFESSRERFSLSLRAGATVAVSGLLLHSLVDYNLHVPANALLFLLQVHLATLQPLASRSALPDADAVLGRVRSRALSPAGSYR